MTAAEAKTAASAVPPATTMIEVDRINSFYGDSHVLFDLSMVVHEREVVALLGRNGAGKSTTLKTLAGVLHPRSGTIRFEGEPIELLPSHTIAGRGLQLVPEERRIFGALTVEENLDLAALSAENPLRLEDVFAVFPRLRERRGSYGRTLSGGEQQMLAIARALMSRPRLLLLDEPSLGLAPLIVRQIFDAIKTLNAEHGLTVFLVEQNAFHALKLAHRGYVMVNGLVTLSGTGRELLERPEVKTAYLEGGRQQVE